MSHQSLVERALRNRLNAYAPYSKFQVGAALRTKSGAVFDGVNVENGSFGATICAERTAIVSAVAAGHREFTEIAIAGSEGSTLMPCGMCRQVLSEFSQSGELIILAASPEGDYTEIRLADLLPHAFKF